jgi:hypothetical protein
MPNPSAPLRNRLDFEALIAETSAALISVAPDQIDAVVESALERLRALASHDISVCRRCSTKTELSLKVEG